MGGKCPLMIKSPQRPVLYYLGTYIKKTQKKKFLKTFKTIQIKTKNNLFHVIF